MARKLPNSPNGRILTNQLSVLIGLPLSCLVLKGAPPPAQQWLGPSAAPCSLLPPVHPALQACLLVSTWAASAACTAACSSSLGCASGTRAGRLWWAGRVPATAWWESATALPLTSPCLAARSWCGCNNSALFAELVPEEQRSTIYAFDRSFEVRCLALAML